MSDPLSTFPEARFLTKDEGLVPVAQTPTTADLTAKMIQAGVAALRQHDGHPAAEMVKAIYLAMDAQRTTSDA